MKDIGGRTAIVTGASKGLGPYIAETLFNHGMKVVLAARDAGALEEVRAHIDPGGTRTLAVSTDVTSEADRVGLLASAEAAFGPVDVLVNNAGTDRPESFVEADFEFIRAMVDLNVTSLMRLTQLALPDMLSRGSGHVVNIASMAGLAPVPYAVVYSATKHAVIGFSESLRSEVKGTGVGVSVVCPYYVREAGLFHENTSGDPGRMATVSPQQVADATVTAIVRNRSRVLVAPPIAQLAPVLRALSPDGVDRAARANGSFATQKKMAEANRRGK